MFCVGVHASCLTKDQPRFSRGSSCRTGQLKELALHPTLEVTLLDVSPLTMALRVETYISDPTPYVTGVKQIRPSS